MHLHQFIRSCVAQHPAGVATEKEFFLWEHLSGELVSLIGESGFDAIYEKALFTCLQEFTWLAMSPKNSPKSQVFADLKSSLMAQTAAEAASANCALLIAFTDILVSLIGENLTGRIMISAWGPMAPVPTTKRNHHV